MTLNDYPKSVTSLNKFLRERGFTVTVRVAGGSADWFDEDGNIVDEVLTGVFRASDQPYRMWAADAVEAQAAADRQVRRRR